MTEKIQHIIDDLRSRKRVLDEALDTEKRMRVESEKKVESLNSQLTAFVQEVEDLKHTVTRLQAELEKAKNQVVDSKPSGNKDVQIDELVREIEYCIGQLKNNA